jgi:hypothetical protein
VLSISHGCHCKGRAHIDFSPAVGIKSPLQEGTPDTRWTENTTDAEAVTMGKLPVYTSLTEGGVVSSSQGVIGRNRLHITQPSPPLFRVASAHHHRSYW